MKPWTTAAIRGMARDASRSPATVSEAPHGLGAVWRRLGTIDIALAAGDALPRSLI
jgi:hypothetical protein